MSFSARYLLAPDGTLKRVPALDASNKAQFDMHRMTMAQQLATTEQRLGCLFLAMEVGPNLAQVRTYWANVTLFSIQNLLVNEVCGRIGRTVRQITLTGIALKSEDILTQIASHLFSVATTSRNTSIDVTADSLYG